jgi:hypothetical protein
VSWRYFPQPEGLVIGRADIQFAVTALQILDQILQSLDQVFAACIDCFLQDIRVGHDKVGRGDGVDELLCVEVELLPCFSIHAIRIVDNFLHPAAGHQVGLLDEIEIGALIPQGRFKTAVALVRLVKGFAVLTQEFPGAFAPQVCPVVPELELHVGQLCRVGYKISHKFSIRFPYAHGVAAELVLFGGHIFQKIPGGGAGRAARLPS